MLGELTHEEIEQLLLREMVGRIGCNAGGLTYVVPTTYAYDGECIYGHSAEGLKLQSMRANPRVCFEVDHVEGIARWRSVIAWGTFEELSGADAERAAKVLRTRFSAGIPTEPALSPHGGKAPGGRHLQPIFYRIRLSEKTGRFEV